MAEAALLARVPTDGLGVAARVTLCLSFHQRRDCIWLWMLLRRGGRGCIDGSPGGPLTPPLMLVVSLVSQLHSLVAVSEEKWQRLH